MPLFEAGSIVSGYRIIELVGKGGMGEVYRAQQISMQRDVALKLLAPALAQRDPKFCQRFIDEARAAGKLSHPNIIAVHDVSKADIDGQTVHFFSMELITGKDFKQLLKEAWPLDIDLVGNAVLGVAEALVYAEANNIIHRDIKPENIMLTDTGQIKLADLGLALQVNEDQEQPIERNDQGKVKVMGTPAYMSPEQARGSVLDSRCDQYCLGATLYHLLSGKAPYSGANGKEIMRAHVFDPVPNPRDVNPECPRHWAKLCMHMMAKVPDERYANADELRDAIQQAIHHRLKNSQKILKKNNKIYKKS